MGERETQVFFFFFFFEKHKSYEACNDHFFHWEEKNKKVSQ